MKEHNIANKNFEEIACWTSKDSGGPVSKTLRRVKNYRNRVAKKSAKRRALQESTADAG